MIGLGFVFPARNPIVARGIKNKQPVPRRRKEKRKKKNDIAKFRPDLARAELVSFSRNIFNGVLIFGDLATAGFS